MSPFTFDVLSNHFAFCHIASKTNKLFMNAKCKKVPSFIVLSQARALRICGLGLITVMVIVTVSFIDYIVMLLGWAGFFCLLVSSSVSH